MSSSAGISTLRKAMPELQTSDTDADRVAYCRDLWPRHHIGVRAGELPTSRPDGIIWPETVEHVSAIVRHCQNEGIPLVPFGAGSGVCGGVTPDDRTVVLDLKKLSRIRNLDRDEMSIDVEAGAMGIRLEEDLADRGFTLGHFPSSILCSTVGGWVAARSAGQCSGRYGKIEDMVAELECVVGPGEIVKLRRRLNGPDLSPMLIGSEGVLGVITSAKLRLCNKPSAQAFGGFTFPDVESGYTAIRDIYQAGLRPAVCRLYDAFDSFMAKRGRVKAQKGPKRATKGAGHKSRWLPGAGATALRSVLRQPSLLNQVIDGIGDRVFGGAMLVLIFDEDEERGQADLAKASALCVARGGINEGEEPARHWLKHRYSVSYRQAPMFMLGAFTDTMEVAAPWSRLGDLYANVRRALGKRVFVMAHLSHAYPDGCSIYFTFAGSGKDAADAQARYDATWKDALAAALEAGGTLSHHHGVGRSKAPKLGRELGHGIDLIEAMRRFVDPSGILNPGNLLPRERGVLVDVPPLEEKVDVPSRLLRVGGDTTLGRARELAERAGLRLGIDVADQNQTVAAWVAAGGPGARDAWADPVDQRVAGFCAKLPSGKRVWIRPTPRRAVGPDLLSLFWGMQERVGAIEWVDLSIVGQEVATPMPCSLDRNPPMDTAESTFVEGVIKSVHDV